MSASKTSMALIAAQFDTEAQPVCPVCHQSLYAPSALLAEKAWVLIQSYFRPYMLCTVCFSFAAACVAKAKAGLHHANYRLFAKAAGASVPGTGLQMRSQNGVHRKISTRIHNLACCFTVFEKSFSCLFRSACCAFKASTWAYGARQGWLGWHRCSTNTNLTGTNTHLISSCTFSTCTHGFHGCHLRSWRPTTPAESQRTYSQNAAMCWECLGLPCSAYLVCLVKM